MHEFIALCRELDAEPLITINMGFEGAFSAEAEMEYANAESGSWAEKRADLGGQLAGLTVKARELQSALGNSVPTPPSSSGGA